MLGDGVIAESYVSFDITWDNPGGGNQIKWDQTKQMIELHELDIYPDLEYTDATAMATYYKYTSANRIVELINQINAVIDGKIAEQNKKANESAKLLGQGDDSGENLPAIVPKPGELATVPKPGELATIPKPGELATVPKPGELAVIPKPGELAVIDKDKMDKPEEIEKPKEEEIKKEEEGEPESTGNGQFSYTVHVIGDRLRFIDIQGGRNGYGGQSEVLIKHVVSENMVKETGDVKINNSEKMKAVVTMTGLLGKTVEFKYEDFNLKDGTNLLVQVMPSIELRFSPSKSQIVPRPESARAEDEWVSDLAKLIKNPKIQKQVIATNEIEKEKANLAQSPEKDKAPQNK